MRPSELRAFMRRHGNAGVLAVGAYLGVRHLWMHHRKATLLAASSLLAAGTALSTHRSSQPHPRPIPSSSSSESQNHSPFLRPNSRPLFRRAKQAFHSTEGSFEYRWLSDSEIFHAEERPSHGPQHLVDLSCYNLRTGKKTRLPRLERLIHLSQAGHIETSPDGKWVLWNGETRDQETIEMATLDGRHHRRWVQHPDVRPWFLWSWDSRHWFEMQYITSKSSYRVIVHDVDYRKKISTSTETMR